MEIDFSPGFYFSLSISGDVEKAAFQEVSGISMEIGTEEVSEGGFEHYVHRLPATVKYSNLVLKRGIVAKESKLVFWCDSIIKGGLSAPITPKNVVLELLDAKGDTLRSWHFHNAYPVKYAISEFYTTPDAIAIESMELAYVFFETM